ncbi:hypothetical protein FOA52_011501 [Chlamydomonas sp. UWO 241]|nr:hypothetical protein FOA52_011501 [Chlamydomonas sp. UWO 241]
MLYTLSSLLLVSPPVTRWLCDKLGGANWAVFLLAIYPQTFHWPAIACGILPWTRTEAYMYWVLPWRTGPTLGLALLPSESGLIATIYHYLLHAIVRVWLCAGPEFAGAPFTSLREYLVVRVALEALQMVSLLAINAQGYANLGRLSPVQRAFERILIGAAVFLLKLWWRRGRGGSDAGCSASVHVASSVAPGMRTLPQHPPTEAPDRQDEGRKHATDHQDGGGVAAAPDAGRLCVSTSPDGGMLCDSIGGTCTLLTAPTAPLHHGATAATADTSDGAAALDASPADCCASRVVHRSVTAISPLGLPVSCDDATDTVRSGGVGSAERNMRCAGRPAGGDSLPPSVGADRSSVGYAFTPAAAANAATASHAAPASLAKAGRGGGPALMPAGGVTDPGLVCMPAAQPAAQPTTAVALLQQHRSGTGVGTGAEVDAGVDDAERVRKADALRAHAKRLMSARATFTPTRTRVRVSIKIPDAEPENLVPGWKQILAGHVARAHIGGGASRDVIHVGGAGMACDGDGDGGGARLVAAYVMRGCTQLILDISVDAAAAVAAALGARRTGGGGGGGDGSGPGILGRASSIEFIGGPSSAATRVHALSQVQQAWLGKCLFDADVTQGCALVGTVQLRGGLLPGWCGECVEPHRGSPLAVHVPGVALAPGASDVVDLPPAAKMQQVLWTQQEGDDATAEDEAPPQLLSLPLRLSGRLPPGAGLHARLSGAFVPILRVLCAACRESVDECTCWVGFSGCSSSQHMLEPLALGGLVNCDHAHDTPEGAAAAARAHVIASASAAVVSAAMPVSAPLAMARAALALPPSPNDPDQDHSHDATFVAAMHQPARDEHEPVSVLASTPAAWSGFVGEGVWGVDVVVELALPGCGLACGVLVVEAVHAGSGALGAPLSLALLPCPIAATELSAALASADPSDASMMADFAAELARWLGVPSSTEALSLSHSVVASGDALLRYALHCGLPAVATLLLDRLAATLSPATQLAPGCLPAAAQLTPSYHPGALLSALFHALPPTAPGDADDNASAAMTHLHLAVASGCPAVVAALTAAARTHGVALDWAVPGGGGVTPLDLADMLPGGYTLPTGGTAMLPGACALLTNVGSAAACAHGVAFDWVLPGGGGVTPLELADMLPGGCTLPTGGTAMLPGGCALLTNVASTDARAHSMALDWAVPGGGGLTPLDLAAMLPGGCALLAGGADVGPATAAAAAALTCSPAAATNAATTAAATNAAAAAAIATSPSLTLPHAPHQTRLQRSCPLEAQGTLPLGLPPHASAPPPRVGEHRGLLESASLGALAATAADGSPLSQESSRSGAAGSSIGVARGVVQEMCAFLDGNPPSTSLTHGFMVFAGLHIVMSICIGVLPLGSLIMMWPYVTVALGSAGMHLVRAATGRTLPHPMLDWLNANLTSVAVTARIVVVCAVAAHGVATGRPLPTWLAQKVTRNWRIGAVAKAARAVFEDYRLSCQLPVVLFLYMPMWWWLYASEVGSSTPLRHAILDAATYLAIVAVKRLIEAGIIGWFARAHRQRAAAARRRAVAAAGSAALVGGAAAGLSRHARLTLLSDNAYEATKPASSPAVIMATPRPPRVPTSAPSLRAWHRLRPADDAPTQTGRACAKE